MNLDESQLCGFIVELGYSEARIMTDDSFIEEVGGIEQGSFLVASNDNRENSYILLRVIEPDQLLDELQKLDSKNEIYSNELVNRSGDKDLDLMGEDDVDSYTKSTLQKQAYSCKVLGTFTGENDLDFGGDIPIIKSGSGYEVYKPKGDQLKKIVNYGIEGESGQNIGELQYSETDLGNSNNYNVNAKVSIGDFEGSKTAFFGMTRTGKSNSIKVLSSAIHSKQLNEDNYKFGQLIIDAAGEYAHPNKQDKDLCLAQLPDTIVYTNRNKWKENENYKPLLDNLYDEENFEQLRDLIISELREELSTDYVKNFVSAIKAVDKDGYKVYNDRIMSIIYCILADLDMEIGNLEFDYKNTITGFRKPDFENNSDADGDFYSRFNWETKVKKNKGKKYINFDELQEMKNFWDDVNRFCESEDIRDAGDSPFNQKTWATLEFLHNDYSGSSKLSNIKHYHSEESSESMIENIYSHLKSGKLVILDMSAGEEDIIKGQAESVISKIYNTSKKRFRNHQTTPNIMVYLEEAHRYLDEDSVDERNVYVRMAKEGAKMDMGLSYATQEVSSIDDRILSNTSNWFITHMNNKSELSNLTNFYDFSDFETSIRQIDEKGYTKLRTVSHRYSIPVRTSKFTEDTVKDLGFKDYQIKPETELTMGDQE